MLYRKKKKNFENDQLKIICWNIRGLNDKLADIENQKLLFQNDIIIIIGTHSTEHLSKKFDTIPNYKYSDFPRKFIHPLAPKLSGSIGVFIKLCLVKSIKVYNSDEAIVWVHLKQEDFGCTSDKLLCCVYFSPHDSSYLQNTIVNTDYFKILERQIAEHNAKGNILICGDLNVRSGLL